MKYLKETVALLRQASAEQRLLVLRFAAAIIRTKPGAKKKD